MDVTDVLRDRVGDPAGFERMAIVSVLAHFVIIGALVLAPGGWLSPTNPVPKTIMTISLSGGNGGPNSGGLTNIGARAVQAETPPDAAKRPEPIRPPAAVTPEMTVPVPAKAPPKPPVKPPAKTPAKAVTPAPVVEQAPVDARGRIPTRGPETREGNAFAETGARGQGFGLSTSGGTGGGSKLDVVGEFCCPEYVTLMVERIRTNWTARAEVTGVVIIKYTIQRNGLIVEATIERSSGYSVLDLNALRAVLGTQQLPPLPTAFNGQTLPVHLSFEYTR